MKWPRWALWIAEVLWLRSDPEAGLFELWSPYRFLTRHRTLEDPMTQIASTTEHPQLVQQRIFYSLVEERVRQETLHGPDSIARVDVPWRVVAIVNEESGEIARAVLAGQRLQYREELVQLAAVCVAAIEAFDRHSGYGVPLEERAAREASWPGPARGHDRPQTVDSTTAVGRGR